ncbi:MAG TPA: CUAEP/CCAEP-tail radical SAM protein [Bryobacteraceae bacterium]
MQVVLISTYDMGRQPFGLASPAAWLRKAGHDVVCADLAVSQLPVSQIQTAGMVAFHLPMHTATRLAAPLIERVRRLNGNAQICCYGLYASINEEYLRRIGATHILGGEFEADLVRLAEGLEPGGAPVAKLDFVEPDRSSLPDLSRYAKLRVLGGGRTVGYTESSRGCKHLCRHCPVVPVYQGAFRVIQREVVLADVRQQVAAGASHITFGDPDFWNGPSHAMRIVEALHAELPDVTFDATIKIEHLKRHRDLLAPLRDAGCLFVTSAVESVDDDVLMKLDKGHTRADFLSVVDDFRRTGLTLVPTFIAFLPWTTRESYAEFLRVIRALDLIENVSPVQLALRLLIPAGSRMLELDEIRGLVTGFDQRALTHQWQYADDSMNSFAARIFAIAGEAHKRGRTRTETFNTVWRETLHEDLDLLPRAAIPYLDEPWYC